MRQMWMMCKQHVLQRTRGARNLWRTSAWIQWSVVLDLQSTVALVAGYKSQQSEG